jgi:hypothetical protein
MFQSKYVETGARYSLQKALFAHLLYPNSLYFEKSLLADHHDYLFSHFY